MDKKRAGKCAAVIDIGSSMLKMRIAQLQKGKIVDLDRLEYPIHLGHEVFTEGKISYESLRELSSALNGFSSLLKEYGITQCTTVATSALRDSENRAYILDQLKIHNNLSVKVLEGDQEKSRIYFEILTVLKDSPDILPGKSLISYIGSGTIGLALYDGEIMISSESIPIGALKLHDMLGSIQNLTEDFHTVLEEYLDSTLDHAIRPLSGEEITNLILTGNEIEQIASLCNVKAHDGRYLLPVKSFKKLYKSIRSLTSDQISMQYHITQEEAEPLYSALAIYMKLIRSTKALNIICPKVELWDSLLRDQLYPKMKNLYAQHIRQNAISCAERLAANFDYNPNHTQAVRLCSEKIFDKTKSFHGLDNNKKLLLDLAAILHDCGHYVTAKHPLRATYHLLQDLSIYGITRQDRLITAFIAGFSEFDTPDFSQPEFLSLSEETKLVISKLTAIFRLANALDKSHMQKAIDIKVKTNGEKMTVTALCNDNFYLERWAFEQCAPFFQDVFGIEPVLVVKETFI